jgi:predicted alpha-1,2-mannosidase
VPVIVDAYFKGIQDFDVEKAYQAMVESAGYKTEGILFPSENIQRKLMPMARKYNEDLGYIPSDLEGRSVSKALEYAYNDWCIAQMAKDLGKTEDYERFMERSGRYAEYYDAEVGFMRGKNSDGSWVEPFDPRYSKHGGHSDYTEGNAFQWSWFVPHDVDGLITLMGGEEAFAKKLDTLFHTSSEITGEDASSDITGLIGQYAHGNEPSHHISHMYNYAGQSWKTQELADEIMGDLYFNDPNGLSGNEDCGAMSAWYALNAMGFYSFCPGAPEYTIGRPVFEKVEISLSNGNVFTVIAKNNSPENLYVQSVTLNGEPLTGPVFKHEELLSGDTLEFEMGGRANKELFK